MPHDAVEDDRRVVSLAVDLSIVRASGDPLSIPSFDMLFMAPTPILDELLRSTVVAPAPISMTERGVSCMICMAVFEHDEAVRWLRCLHGFHATCVDPWFKESSEAPTCPLCRHPV
jgi:hypothetical protein